MASSGVGFFESPDQIDAMIQKYRADTLEDAEDEDDEEQEENRKTKWVDSWWFNMIIGLLIVLNALTIGLETDANRGGGTSTGWWYIFELVFSTAFAMELLCRLHQHRSLFFTDPVERNWNILDFSIVMLSVVDALILMPLGLSSSLRFVSMLRFIRLMRLVRLIRLLRMFRELWLVASGLIQALKTLIWICIVLFFVCYIASIFATIMIGRNDLEFNKYFKDSGTWDHEFFFKTVPSSLLTFFQMVTLDNWAELIVRDAVRVQPVMYVFFVGFIVVGTFGVLNLMIGVVVERAIRTAANDTRETKKKRDRDRMLVFNQLREIFEAADVDNSGTLSLQEVEEAINKPEIYNKLRMIDFPVDNPREVFVLLDYDNTGELTIEEFIKGCLRMKGPAMSKDLLVAQVAIDGMAKQYQLFETELQQFKRKLKRLDATARAISTQGEKVFLDPTQYRARHPSHEQVPSKNTATSESQPWHNYNRRASEKSSMASASARGSAMPSVRQSALADAPPTHPQLGNIREEQPQPPALPDGYHRQWEQPMPPALEGRQQYPALPDSERALALPGELSHHH